MNDRDSNDDDDNEGDVLCGGNDENVDASSTRINISSHIVIPGGGGGGGGGGGLAQRLYTHPPSSVEYPRTVPGWPTDAVLQSV